MRSIFFPYLNSLALSGTTPKVLPPPDEALPCTLHYHKKHRRYYLTSCTANKKDTPPEIIYCHTTLDTLIENLTRIANDLHYLMLRPPQTHPTKLTSLYFYFTIFCHLATATESKSHLHLQNFLPSSTPDALADTDKTMSALANSIQILQSQHGQRFDNNESDDSDTETNEGEKWQNHQAFQQPSNEKVHTKALSCFSSCLTWLENEDNKKLANQPLSPNKNTMKQLKKSGMITCLENLKQFIHTAGKLALSEEEQHTLEQYNTAITTHNETKAMEIAQKKGIMIGHYRGLHFKPKKMSTQIRRALRNPTHKKNTYYSEEVVAGANKKINQTTETSYLSHQTAKHLLEKSHQSTLRKLLNLTKTGPIIMPSHRFYQTPYFYNNFLHSLLEAYSHGIPTYLTTIQELRLEPALTNRLPEKNPFISTTIRARHAIRYALGLKEPNPLQALRPNYHTDGHASFPHTGKVIIALTPASPRASTQYANIPMLGTNAQLSSKEEHIVEQETCFFGALENCPHEHIIRFPNFSLPWQPFFESKYGLPRTLFDSISNTLNKLKPNTLLANLVEKVIAEILCLLLEPKIQQVALLHARKQGGFLAFPNNDGTLSTTPPNARLYIKGKVHQANRDFQHVMTNIRIALAKQCLLNRTTPSFPLSITKAQTLHHLRSWQKQESTQLSLCTRINPEASDEDKKNLSNQCLLQTSRMI